MRYEMNTLPDNSCELIVRSRDGDLTAFQQLVEQYQGYAFTLAFRMLGNEDEANDTVQETFIRVWKHITKFNFSSKFTTWLFRIVTNLRLDRLKSGKRKNNVISSVYEQVVIKKSTLKIKKI
jgi:RNA polymerase sigma-70 factor (ECF subfamily)